MPEWLTLWAAVQGIALSAAAFIAWYQIRALRADQRGWETLKACERYDTDPVINASLIRLKVARDGGDLAKDPKKYSADVTTVLNYLDGIATGVDQGFYNEPVVRDHLEGIMRDHVGEFLAPNLSVPMKIEAKDFSRLDDLLKTWKSDKTYYRRWRW